MTDRYVRMVDGVEVPMTADEIAERQAEENAAPPPLTPLEQLRAMFTQLPVEIQSLLGETAAAVFMFLDQGNPAAARQKILDTVVSDELIELKNNMLGVFDA